MKKSLPLFMTAICVSGLASAQFYVPSEEPIPNVTSVTNEGVTVGANDQNQPFYIWDAVNNTQRLIGGISSGQGVGGNPHFAESGKILTAPMSSDNIGISTKWEKAELPVLADYNFCRTFYVGDYSLLAIGTSKDGKEGIIAKSANNGLSWKRFDLLSRKNEEGKWENYTPDFPIYSIAHLAQSKGTILVGGGNGTLLSGSGNGSWQKAELTGFTTESPISAYRDMTFTYQTVDRGYEDATEGCMLLELEDGSRIIVYTHDGGESFSIAEGFPAKATTLGCNGTDFFLGTSDGTIQTSSDGGKTWRDVYNEPAKRPMHRIIFADDQKGVALSDNVIYITRDGGKTWTQTVVISNPAIGFPKTSTWNDAVWLDDCLMLVGTNACYYKSTDDGATFSEVKGFMGDLGTLFYDARKVTTIFGQEGMVWRKEDKDQISGYTGGIYNVETDTWTPLVSSGIISGESASSPWDISGDGQHVVGIAYGTNKSNNVVAHAAVWTGTDKVELLPNRFADRVRACRANAVNYDGSVIVGWQDIFGPWYGSVWRKGTDGSYTQQMMTVNPEKGQDDINYEDKPECYENLAGTCQTVSDDGKWIGGRGNPDVYGVSGAWIWSEETGYKVLYENEDATTSAINSDGTMAVGWVGPGSGAWIWTQEEGLSPLQDYLENRLGYDLKDFYIVSVYDMSPNGRYLCGYGMQGDTPMAYVVDLFKTVGVEEMEAAQIKAAIYPNPASEELHVDLPFDSSELNTTLTLTSLNGQIVKRLDSPQASNVIDIRNLTSGMYVLDVNANGKHKSFKVIVK